MLKSISAAFNFVFSAVVKEEDGEEVSVINLKLLSRTQLVLICLEYNSPI